MCVALERQFSDARFIERVGGFISPKMLDTFAYSYRTTCFLLRHKIQIHYTMAARWCRIGAFPLNIVRTLAKIIEHVFAAFARPRGDWSRESECKSEKKYKMIHICVVKFFTLRKNVFDVCLYRYIVTTLYLRRLIRVVHQFKIREYNSFSTLI